MQIKEVPAKNKMVRTEIMIKGCNSGNKFSMMEWCMDIRDYEGYVGAFHGVVKTGLLGNA